MARKKKMIYDADPYLMPFKAAVDARHEAILQAKAKYAVDGELSKGINNHLYYGLHHTENGWIIREWAPNATRIFFISEVNNWKKTPAYEFKAIGNGNWELFLPEFFLQHGQLYRLYIEWPGGGAERLPAYVRRVVQDEVTKQFSAQVWEPVPYEWKHRRPAAVTTPLIYECHIGMSGEEEKVATFEEFRTNVLPRVKRLGYNVLQIMALQEHPYYGSFGYQVSNFFALSSRFGTPEEFKALVDEAHSMGIAVIMDIVQSHSVDNEAEGLGKFDGREDLYFYPGAQGHHPAWGSRCFDYGKDEVRFFLLSNVKFWLEEYHLDGFRFDGVTSMMYWDHGLGVAFSGYDNYFNNSVDESAVVYLALANILIKEIYPKAISIAEDVSGMAGLAAPLEVGGVGFGYRMAMGVADHWIKWIKEKSDDQWSMGEIWYELTNKRDDEKTVSYAECHDQAMVGDKTIIFRLMDKEMYTSMNTESSSLIVDRGMALHKMIRLATLSTAGNGYLNFMGNEFGHPEWIDFPREGNAWSHKYARRQWSLSEPYYLRYHFLRDFDEEMVTFARKEKLLTEKPVLLTADEEKQILIFMRKDNIFAFNFSADKSIADYQFASPEGTYEVVFSSDEKRFDGFDRVVRGERHQTLGEKSPNGNIVLSDSMKLYLPCRSCMVLKKINA